MGNLQHSASYLCLKNVRLLLSCFSLLSLFQSCCSYIRIISYHSVSISGSHLSLLFYVLIIEMTSPLKHDCRSVSNCNCCSVTLRRSSAIVKEEARRISELSAVEISITDYFQGREAEAVIISMVSILECLLFF